ncbi:MAG: Hpt domain-containing protein [Pseudomonadota bacterium]|nr:Hpt domain-containing protein [Pseudomonadota bacterium]
MNEFHLKMEQLSAAYRETVAAELRKLREQAETLCGDERDRDCLQQMTASLHRLAGGAGVFGIHRLSERAQGLEFDLNDWLAAPLADDYRQTLPDLRASLMNLTAE